MSNDEEDLSRSKRKNLVETPEELATEVRGIIKRLGISGAMAELGVGRDACLSLGCGLNVTTGTMALVSQRLRSGDGSGATV